MRLKGAFSGVRLVADMISDWHDSILKTSCYACSSWAKFVANTLPQLSPCMAANGLLMPSCNNGYVCKLGLRS